MYWLVSEGFFLLFVVMKLPLAGAVAVVYWAFNAEPREPVPARVPAPRPKPWSPRGRAPRRLVPGPHGSPTRAPLRPRRSAALARAEARR